LSAEPLFSEAEIAVQVARVAKEIAQHSPRPDLAVPILTGAFVFAADLLRALSREGLDLPVEFLSLTRYGRARKGTEAVIVRMGASESVRDRHVLIVDGVLDHGHTLEKARALLVEAGAASAAIAVAVDKSRRDGLLKSDFAAFTRVDAFIVGYGMDDGGRGRGIPYIARVK
jgi:hypoxanthine phosphoribosyltransferase